MSVFNSIENTSTLTPFHMYDDWLFRKSLTQTLLIWNTWGDKKEAAHLYKCLWPFKNQPTPPWLSHSATTTVASCSVSSCLPALSIGNNKNVWQHVCWNWFSLLMLHMWDLLSFCWSHVCCIARWFLRWFVSVAGHFPSQQTLVQSRHAGAEKGSTSVASCKYKLSSLFYFKPKLGKAQFIWSTIVWSKTWAPPSGYHDGSCWPTPWCHHISCCDIRYVLLMYEKVEFDEMSLIQNTCPRHQRTMKDFCRNAVK